MPNYAPFYVVVIVVPVVFVLTALVTVFCKAPRQRRLDADIELAVRTDPRFVVRPSRARLARSGYPCPPAAGSATALPSIDEHQAQQEWEVQPVTAAAHAMGRGWSSSGPQTEFVAPRQMTNETVVEPAGGMHPSTAGASRHQPEDGELACFEGQTPVQEDEDKEKEKGSWWRLRKLV